MKKIIPLALLCFLFMHSKAQVNKGSLLIGGSFGVGWGNTIINGPDNNFHGFGFTVSPSIGKAIKTNTILGAGLTFNYEKSGSVNPVNNGHNYGASIFLRKYLPLGSLFNLFGESSVNYINNLQKNTGSVNVGEKTDWSAGLSFYPGIDYKVNKRVRFELGWNQLLSLGYSHSVTKGPNNQGTVTKSKGFSLNTSLQGYNPVTLGFRILLSK
jgi:hypothetical protein